MARTSEPHAAGEPTAGERPYAASRTGNDLIPRRKFE